MAFLGGRIIVVCFLSQLGGLHGADITISILDEKTSHKKRAVGRRGSCALCFHLRPTPSQKAPGGEIKGRGTGTHASFFSLLSLASFQGCKWKFRTVVEQALYQRPHWDTAHCLRWVSLQWECACAWVVFVHSNWWQRENSAADHFLDLFFI